jgi:UDP-GlcNAc:undecaprenyl-phosphate GlcNAc-1-phosphate transferase
MVVAITALAVALALSLVTTPIVRRVASVYGLFDHAHSARKIHGRPIPRLGGIAIVVAFVAALGYATIAGSGFWRVLDADHHLVLGIVGGGLCIAALGVWDDLAGLGAKPKLAVQFAVAGLAYAAGLRIDTLSLPLVGTVELGVLGLPLTLVWIAGVTNAMNLVDGMDGLAGGIALIALGASFTLAAVQGDALVMLLAGALAGAVLGFLFFNFHPASIFMGDTGSMFLGYVLATMSIRTAATAEFGASAAPPVALVVPIVALGVPILDTLLAIARRALRGAPLFSADRGHLHHRLLDRGFTQRQASLTLYGMSAALALTALVLVRATDGDAVAALAIVGVATLVALRWLGFLRRSELAAMLAERRRALEPAPLVEDVPESANEGLSVTRIAG